MNYQRPQLLEQLGADYALGTLRGRARARFERLCAALPAAQAIRQRWEDRLLPLALAGAELEPQAASWPAIQRRLARLPSDLAPRRGQLAGWRWAAAAAIVLIVVMIGRFTLRQPEWQLVATLAPANSAAQWRVERSADAQRLAVHTRRTVPAAPATSFELWALPADGGKPISLGLIPASGNLERSLTAAQRASLLGAVKLAVTLEPPGGAPNGVATGPIIVVADVARSG